MDALTCLVASSEGEGGTRACWEGACARQGHLEVVELLACPRKRDCRKVTRVWTVKKEAAAGEKQTSQLLYSFSMQRIHLAPLSCMSLLFILWFWITGSVFFMRNMKHVACWFCKHHLI